MMKVPVPDYLRPGSFGSLELRRSESTEFIGQPIDYAEERAATIRSLTIDSLGLARIDLIKLDVEGMEIEALAGAKAAIERARPILIVEAVKSDKAALRATLEQLGYRLFEMGINLLAIHESDRTAAHVTPS
jgi:hypothetical protein